ncbi:MAG: OmpA family protein, partial [bacterium]|nr:OmpA family protein [bacterium]
MKWTTKLASALFVLGLIGIFGYYVAVPFLTASRQVSTSDAAYAKGVIRVGKDNFIGYFPLCSTFMAELMLADGIQLKCLDDGADYAQRFMQFRDGELELAVATVDTYVLGGERVNYPGVIVSVLDESKGGDAIVANQNAVKSLTDLQQGRSVIKVAFTPDSPSHHLLKVVGRDFDIPIFLSKDPGWKIETKGSPEALTALLSGKAQVAVLWEPDIAKALAKPGIIRLLGSEKTDKVIVDILTANRDYNNRYPERVKLLLNNYFKTLKYYRDNPDKLRKDAAVYAKVPEDAVEQMLKGIAWASLTDNATLWLGVPAQGQMPAYGLIDTIEKTVRILSDVGDVTGNPLPGADPRSIINSTHVAALFAEGVIPSSNSANPFLPQQVVDPLAAAFSPLAEDSWRRLREVGTLRIPPLLFQSGTSTLTLEDEEQLDMAAEALKSYPYFRIEVDGHTRPGSDEAANQTLSEERADA